MTHPATVGDADLSQHAAAIVQSSDDAIVGATLDGIVTIWNRGAERLFGYAAAEVVGRSLAVLVPPEIPDEVSAVLARVRRGEHVGHFETVRVRKDGSRLDVSMTISPVRDGAGAVTGAVAIARDVTERAAAAQAFQEQARLATLVAAVAGALTHHPALAQGLGAAAAAVVRHLDAAFARIWTLDAAEDVLVLRASAGMYTHLDGAHGRVPVGQYKIGLIARERTPHLTNQVIGDPRVGDQEWASREGMVAFAGYPLMVEDRVVGVLAMFARQPLTEATLQALGSAADSIALAIEGARTAEALRTSERRFRALVEHGTDLTALIGADRKLLYSSPNTERVLGHPPAERLGRDALEAVHPDDLARTLGAFVQLRAAPDQVAAFDLRLRHADGSWRWMEGTGQNLLDEPEVRAIAVNFRDVTERKEMERQRALVARGEKMRALGQMAGGIAHDLNQSLALIAGYGEIAARAVAGGEGDTAMLREALDTMSSAAMSGGETVKRLLTFARTNPDGAPEPVHVAAVLREVAQLTAPQWRDAAQAEGRAISLHVESDGDAVVEGWAPSLREALTNLVLNAVDALPSGGTIKLTARRAGDRVVVEVVDSGVGMPPAVRERVFEPFFTTKGERGTGLGLAMVFGIVERHGGTVAVESASGQGTAFHLSFPAAAPSAAVAVVEAAPVTTLRILAVDDEPRLSRMVALMLGQAGHRVATATSGEEALERLERESFDLVISDLGMGEGMTGWELADAVQRRWPGIRVALATGWGAQIDPEEARARGVAGVLAKPFGGAELIALLGSV